MTSQSAQGSNGSSVPASFSSGPPYHPLFAILGRYPSVSVDDAIGAVILAIFVVAALLNLTICWRNFRQSHNFFLSLFLAVFCAARIIANALRISWASHLENVKIIIAAQVFLSAGVVMLFVMNMILSQRLLRAYQPHIGWNKSITVAFKFLYASITADIVMVIVALVYGFYTRDLDKLHTVRDVQRVGVTYLAVISFLPIPIAGFCLLLPRKEPVDKFGEGSMGMKVCLVVFTAVLLSLGAGFRAGIALQQARLSTYPAWYHHKACFYVFTYLIEIIVVYSYTLFRFDRRFYIPDGSYGPGHYSASTDSATLQNRPSGVSVDLKVLGDGTDGEQSRTISTPSPQQDQNSKEAQSEV
ncbi:hypothetical protein B0T10DRAFT_158053 [Thelonectria olida]|uniref:Uncharacterized protein n=1 Tax=Thelonectria olida TaxID=1576542 RepID=A0A9P8VVN5_9HYPO|nr:hypothetical protein B0T10DRAFT_158053 [Thelonectria olida]